MLEDPDTSDLISWSSHGDLFSVSNPTSFSKTVLPQYFKHNNWQSFVRQLNSKRPPTHIVTSSKLTFLCLLVYGFHKVNDLIHSNLTNENQTWEFKHPNFRKGAVGDLQHIKRKSAKAQLPSPQFNFNSSNNNNINTINTNNNSNDSQYTPLQNTIKADEQQREQPQETLSGDNSNNNSPVIKHILRIEEHLLGVTKSCESLFNEVVHLRMVVSKQQDVSFHELPLFYRQLKFNGYFSKLGNARSCGRGILQIKS